MKATHPVHPNQTEPTLYMALELSKNKWDLAFAIGRAQPPRRRSIDARDLDQLQEEIRTTWAGAGSDLVFRFTVSS